MVRGILEAAAEHEGEAPDTVHFHAYFYSADRPSITFVWDKASRNAARHSNGTKFTLTVDAHQLAQQNQVAMRNLVGAMHGMPNTSVYVAHGEVLADFYAAEGRSTTNLGGKRGVLHTKLVRFGYLLLSGSPNASTAALANIETCTLTWLNERGHAKYLALEGHILARSTPYRGEGALT